MSTTHSTRRTSRIRQLVWASLMTALLVACESQPEKEPTERTSDTGLTLDDIPAQLERANTASGAERADLLLQATRTLLDYGELAWARNTLESVDPSNLNDTAYMRYTILSASMAMANGDYFVAKGILWDDRFRRLLPNSPKPLEIEARELRAVLLYDIAEFRESFQERLTLQKLVRDDPVLSGVNQDLTWIALMELPLADLQLESKMQNDTVARGWYTLAALSKNNQTNLRQQLEEVDNWRRRWPSHPASLRLPADLQLLKQLVESQPQQVALLLPLSGKLEKAAEAIRDGFMAGFYNRLSESGYIPDVRLYDTSGTDINQVYDTAIAEGAQMVVGPLDKDNIQELALRPELPVQTLALNTIENPLGETINLYQFGLAIEDEAIQVAERAWRDGHRRAMVLAPAGEWGNRSATAFLEKWQFQGGEITGDYRFSSQKDYSRLIENSLKVADSKDRANQMRRLLGKRIEHEPRRRQDIDFIFMVAHPSQARQLKPTLAFHYGRDIPVYATSHIFNGETDAGADRDMNGIRFTTLPWFFNESLPEKQSIENFASKASPYQSLYALGVDAYHLYPRLRQLAEVSQAHFYGATGNLRLDPQRRVLREQTWAQYVNGQAYPMPTVSQDEFSGNE